MGHHKKLALGGIGILLVGIVGTGAFTLGHGGKKKPKTVACAVVCIAPNKGPQLTQVELIYPGSNLSGKVQVAWTDGATGVSYLSDGNAAGGKVASLAPWMPCLGPQGSQPHPLSVSVAGAKGAPFTLICVIPFIHLDFQTKPDPAIADGKSTSTITMTGEINFKMGSQTISKVVKGIKVDLDTDLGVLADSSIETDESGQATTTITSDEAGLATVTPTPESLGGVLEGSPTATVTFNPRIDSLAEAFSDSESTTFVSAATTPSATKQQLVFTWTLNNAACGSLISGQTTTGANGYVHPGCDVAVEHTITATLKVSDTTRKASASCTYFVRGFEDQGPISPPPCQ